MIIFSNGFNEEVIQTLRLNFERETLDIFPVKIDIEIDTINVLNDIAIICGGDIISSLKGNTLTFVKYEDIPVIDFISCVGKNITINNSKSSQRSELQLQEILKQLNKSDNEFIIKSLNNRIKSLTSNVVSIKIASDSEIQNIKNIEKIDLALRVFKSVLKFGVVDVKKIIHSIKNNFMKEIIENTYKIEKIPAFTFASATKLGIDLVNNIISINSIVIKD